MGRWAPDARVRLQEAALALFAERGYDETTVAEIAEAAGLTKRTFFRHFTDKREVLFWGSELLQQEMVTAVGTAPGAASAWAMIGAALDAAGAQFEQVRDFAAVRLRIVTSSSELRERELIKATSMAAAMAEALRARGVDADAADLVAHMGVTVMRIAYERWADDPDRKPFQEIARDALARLREIAAAG